MILITSITPIWKMIWPRIITSLPVSQEVSRETKEQPPRSTGATTLRKLFNQARAMRRRMKRLWSNTRANTWNTLVSPTPKMPSWTPLTRDKRRCRAMWSKPAYQPQHMTTESMSPCHQLTTVNHHSKSTTRWPYSLSLSKRGKMSRSQIRSLRESPGSLKSIRLIRRWPQGTKELISKVQERGTWPLEYLKILNTMVRWETQWRLMLVCLLSPLISQRRTRSPSKDL